MTPVGDFHDAYAYLYMCLFSLMCLHDVCGCMIYMIACLRMFYTFVLSMVHVCSCVIVVRTCKMFVILYEPNISFVYALV